MGKETEHVLLLKVSTKQYSDFNENDVKNSNFILDSRMHGSTRISIWKLCSRIWSLLCLLGQYLWIDRKGKLHLCQVVQTIIYRVHFVSFYRHTKKVSVLSYLNMEVVLLSQGELVNVIILLQIKIMFSGTFSILNRRMSFFVNKCII